jgi:hypothetical protein
VPSGLKSLGETPYVPAMGTILPGDFLIERDIKDGHVWIFLDSIINN